MIWYIDTNDEICSNILWAIADLNYNFETDFLKLNGLPACPPPEFSWVVVAASLTFEKLKCLDNVMLQPVPSFAYSDLSR